MSRAAVLAEMAANDAAVRVVRIADAEALALDALSLAGSGRWDVTRAALYALGWARSLGGRPIDDVCDRFQVPASVLYYFASSPERVAGQRLVWRGELAEARAFLLTLLAAADERGEPSSYALAPAPSVRARAPRGRVGRRRAEARRMDGVVRQRAPRLADVRALPGAPRHRPRIARRGTTLGRGGNGAASPRPASAGTCSNAAERSGHSSSSAHDPGKAVEQLRPVWEHTEREGVRDPGAFPVAPELVEALVDVGELEEARRRDSAPGRAGGRAGSSLGARYRRSLHRDPAASAETYDEQAAAALARSAGELAALGLAPDRARALLSLGRAQRRFRKWGAARETLEDAAVGVRRAGLARLGGRGSFGARSGRRTAAGTGGRADRRRTTSGRARSQRAREQGDRPGDGRQRQDGRVPPLEHLREARDPVARRACAVPWGRRSPGTKP